MNSMFDWKPVLLAGLIVSIGQFSMGLIMPALPWVALDFAISAEQAQRLVSIYLLGFGPSQLIYGPLSDAIGRKPVLISGLLLAVAGLTIAVTGADSFELLTFGRFVQGLGAGCCAVLARASIRDSYNESELPRALSWLTIVASFTPIIAPVLGGFINAHLGWLAVFVSLCSYILLVLMLLLYLFKETVNEKRKVPRIGKIIETYSGLLRSGYFLSFASIGWFNFSLVVTTISVMPFIMQIEIGMTSDEYALWALIPAFGLLLGGTFSNRIRPVLGTHKTLMLAPLLHISSAIWFLSAPLKPGAMMFGQLLLTMGNGIALPCAQTLLLTPYKKNAGSVAALSGAGQMIISAVVSMLLMSLGINQAWHLGLTILFITFLCTINILVGLRKRPNTEPD